MLIFSSMSHPSHLIYLWRSSRHRRTVLRRGGGKRREKRPDNTHTGSITSINPLSPSSRLALRGTASCPFGSISGPYEPTTRSGQHYSLVHYFRGKHIRGCSSRIMQYQHHTVTANKTRIISVKKKKISAPIRFNNCRQ